MTQQPIQLPPPPPPPSKPTVEIEIDMLARLVEIMGGGRFPDTAARDLVTPLLYCSRVVTEAAQQLQMKQAQSVQTSSYGMPGGVDLTPEVPADGPPTNADFTPEVPVDGPPSGADFTPEV